MDVGRIVAGSGEVGVLNYVDSIAFLTDCQTALVQHEAGQRQAKRFHLFPLHPCTSSPISPFLK